MINDFLEDYQVYEEEEALDDFLFNLWSSKYEPNKITKTYRFEIDRELIKDEKIIKLFEPYQEMKVKYAKSFHKDNPKSIDMIKIHINNMYMYLVDKEVYLGREYYDAIFKYRSYYYNVVERISNGEIISYEEVENNLNELKNKENLLLKERLSKKIELSQEEYKKLIDDSIYKLFNNYKSPEIYEQENGWEMRDENTGWTEDNYIVKYFCKSLTGSMMDYVKWVVNKKTKRCKDCEVEITGGNRKNRCDKCKSSYIRAYDRRRKAS